MSRFSRTQDATKTARALRSTVSRAEYGLWPYLRGAQLGVSFRRLHPIGPDFADYYCAEHLLVVEIDGDHHNAVRDERRDKFLEDQGLKVLRCSADDARNETEGVVENIQNCIAARHLEMTAPSAPLPTSPFQGEEN